jgi:Histidine kinase-, DNA gyrase B-, and HSP90-like ATPase
MLGEIVLPQWRCLAELIDNSIDSFIEAQRFGSPIQNPLVSVTIPTGNSYGGRLSVRDNGPGMDWNTLERAARAGWTSHDPINNLGLFGMGFNIATARLGLRTTIWTTRTGVLEWIGLEIDFEQLTKQQAFVSPPVTRPKSNPDLSGTEVIVERLKPEQADWLSRGSNRSNVSRQLGKTYSSMIGPARNPIGFRLEINGNQVRPKLHCIWGGPGNPERAIETARHGTVNAFQPVDVRLEPRPFCTQCWNWLGPNQTTCPSCEATDSIVRRERRVHGWLGIQRYLDRSDYGIDILRNGRKIEVGSKDLFKWLDENSDIEITEYPIDDPRDRGRIVGEIHLDHCRVPYTKDRFVREDAAWREMVGIVRGNTPLRPENAAKMGAGENNSPLYRLFQVFRRSNPHNRRSGGWNRILVVPDNDRAQAMAKYFDAGESEYQTDEKWWELIQEAETEVLQGGTTLTTKTKNIGGHPDDTSSETLGGESRGDATPMPTERDVLQDDIPSPIRTRIASLSHQYTDDLTGQRYDVEAFGVEADDPEMTGLHCPWTIRRTAAGPWEFYVDTSSAVFRSITLTPLDALLMQLAWLIADFGRAQASPWTFGAILTALREKYATAYLLDPQDLVSEALAQLVDLARSIVGRLSVEDARASFDGLSPSRQEGIRVAMASRGVANPHGAIDDARFLQYSSPGVISEFILSNPSMFFDGNYWDEPYSALDYGSSVATDEARTRLLGHYGGLLADVVWLAQQTPVDLEDISRERLMRAFLAVSPLAPTASVGDGE